MIARRLYLATVRWGWVLGVSVTLLIWELASVTGLLNPLVAPGPRAALLRLLSDGSNVETWRNVAATAEAWLLGGLIGYIFAAAVAVLVVLIPRTYPWVRPYLIIGNSIPRVVLAPVFILALGIGLGSRLGLSISIVVFPVIFGIYGGLRLADPRLITVVENFGASSGEVWQHVIIPSSLPYLLSSARLALSLGLLGAIVGEILLAPSGLGWLIRTRSRSFDLEGVFSALLIVMIAAVLVNVIIDLLEARLLRWQ